jgi:hypothetical protein
MTKIPPLDEWLGSWSLWTDALTLGRRGCILRFFSPISQMEIAYEPWADYEYRRKLTIH